MNRDKSMYNALCAPYIEADLITEQIRAKPMLLIPDSPAEGFRIAVENSKTIKERRRRRW